MDGVQLDVDVSLLDEHWSQVRTGLLCQWIGRLVSIPRLETSGLRDGASYVLQARLVRVVEGLDVALYQEVLNIQRQFLLRHHNLK